MTAHPFTAPRVGFLRPEATFTHIAARQRFGPDAAYMPLETDAICRAVQHEDLDYGVLPIENLFEGTVGATLDALYATADIGVVAEIILPIHHHLLAKESLERIVRVYSHEQALSQCRNHLRRLEQEVGRELELVREASTARGAQRAAAEPGTAAIATEMAAEVYGLRVLRRNMEDGRDNATRFWVFGRGAVPPATGNDKTSFLLEVANKPGALATVLTKFADHGLNATMIQSRPLRLDRATGLWEYAFFVEFLGHIHDPPLAEVYRLLDKGRGVLCRRIRLLGSYPRAPLLE
ncbi:MAG: prephenate dehydratase [Chloroflexi bacterium]|nr:prephenate dehydratase [Chloroflexota bacterium]